MKILLVLMWGMTLVLNATGQVANQPPGSGLRPAGVSVASNPPPELPRFDFDFQGGTPSELVEALNKPLNGTLNVVIPEDANDVMIPAMKLKDVNVAQVFAALQKASMKMVPYRVGGVVRESSQVYEFSSHGPATVNTVWAFSAIRPTRQLDESSYRFYQLGPYLEGLKIEDITTAIQTALKMLKIEPGPELKFHPETKLLIAVGKEADFALIDDVLKQLPKGASKAMRLSEVLVNGFVNKPGNITLPKDQKLTIVDAIGRAGGLTTSPRATGQPKADGQIKFTRPGEGERSLKFDELKKENDPTKLIYLEPGDVIEVQ